jgi:putative endonuclease
MKQFNSKTGKRAEDKAAHYIQEKGMIILERNYRSKFGEIDIIANDENTIVFVEVKAKVGAGFGLPEEMINKNKLQKVRNMAAMYLGGKLIACRIDVIAVVFDDAEAVTRLTHYENVY